MYGLDYLSKLLGTAEEIPFNDYSKIILMSDCHRGDGSWADSFSKNQNIYFAALMHYFNENYTYIELGDGDELWENKNFSSILREHSDAFWMIGNFIKAGRFYSLYGNHDMVKKNKSLVRKKDYRRTDGRRKRYLDLLSDVKFHEALVLRHVETGNRIFLIHGHQVDFLNSKLWKVAGFMVRYLWKPLELLGVNDPTSPAQNYKKKATVEEKLIEWVNRENVILIAGHTHRPTMPDAGEPPYFNDGSCVHPRCITGIEIAYGKVTLVKWSVKTKPDGSLAVGRDILEGPRSLYDYFPGAFSKEKRLDKVLR